MNSGGLREFLVKHTVRNLGLTSTGIFDSVWRNGAVPGDADHIWLPIASGGSTQGIDIVRLGPGTNPLSLAHDEPNHVKER